MRESLRRFWFMWALVVGGILWAVSFALNPAGLQGWMFYKHGANWFSDFYMIQDFLLQADYYRPLSGNWYDSNYTALPRLIFDLFPYSLSGAVAFMSVSSILYIGSLLIFAKERGLPCALTILAGVCTDVFIGTFERGNSITMAAAAVVLFLAWFDSEIRWKRIVAAAMLAFAGISKISPALLGFLYFRRKQWYEIFCCAGFALLMFFVPFFIPGYGGVDGICQWFLNAKDNSQHYALMGWFGVSKFLLSVGDVMKCFGYKGEARGVVALMHLSKVLGFIVFVGSFAEKKLPVRVFLIMAALLVIPGNQHKYCALYLIPIMFWLSIELNKWWLKLSTLIMFFPYIIPCACLSALFRMSCNALTMVFSGMLAANAIYRFVKTERSLNNG